MVSKIPRLATISHEYSYDVSTNKHDFATVALRIRPSPVTTTIRHECFKMFKTSVALPWSFPNHHDSSRFTTVLLRIPTVHNDFTNRGECLRHCSQKSWMCKQALREIINISSRIYHFCHFIMISSDHY